MPLKCVPLVPEMHGSSSRLDLKAIYRRKKTDNFGAPILDAQGREQWDLTAGLPLRRHDDWIRKGFEYITLADEQSLIDARGVLHANGIDWQVYANQDRRTRSPFNAAIYQEDARSNHEQYVAELRRLIAEIGAEAVLAVKRSDHPGFQFPPEVQAEVDAAAMETPRRGRRAQAEQVPA